MSKGLSLQELNDLEFQVTPMNHFEQVSYLKFLCKNFGIEYNSLFIKDNQIDILHLLAKLPEIFSKLDALFVEEFEKINENKADDEPKEHGKAFIKWVNIISVTSGISKDRLILTNPKYLVEIFTRILIDPKNAFEESFFLKKIFRLMNMIPELIYIERENLMIQSKDQENVVNQG
jgi:hypothetical protein